MIIIGEKLNSSIPRTLTAIENNDSAYLIQLIKNQVDSGADYLDMNTAICGEQELSKLLWLVSLAMENSKCGIMLDSPSPSVIEEAIKAVKDRPIFINSVTLNDRINELLPVIKQTGASVVALPIDSDGMPDTVEKRVSNALKLVEKITSYSVEPQKIYIDVLAEALSVGNENAMIALNTIKELKTLCPKVNTICGISNISFGLPKRININSAFLTGAILAGIDSVIVDITSPQLKSVLYSALAVAGKDDYCLEYISHIRENE